MTEKTDSPTPKWSAVWRLHPPGGERALGGALHLGVEVGLIPLVERPRRARAERDAQHGGEAEHRMDRAPARRAARTAR